MERDARLNGAFEGSTRLRYQSPRIVELGSVTGLTLGNTSGTNPDIGEHQNDPDEPNTGYNCGHGGC